MSAEQPVLGLDVARCSGCSEEPSSAPSPAALPVMADILPVRIGQRARRTGCRQPLMGCPFLGESSWEQRQASSEGGRPGTSRGLSTSDSSKSGESGSSRGVARAWSS